MLDTHHVRATLNLDSNDEKSVINHGKLNEQSATLFYIILYKSCIKLQFAVDDIYFELLLTLLLFFC